MRFASVFFFVIFLVACMDSHGSDTTSPVMCVGDADCVAEKRCVRLYPDSETGVCRRVCKDQACPDGEQCIDFHVLEFSAPADPESDPVENSPACFTGCIPGVSEQQNNCSEPGINACVPLPSGTEGLCLKSGYKSEGEICEFPQNQVFAECNGNNVCVQKNVGDSTGTCKPLCTTHSAGNSYDSGCGEGEVCVHGGLSFGYCDRNVTTPEIEVFQPCPVSGSWCSDGVLCVHNTEETSICVPLCRFEVAGVFTGGGENDCDGYLYEGRPTICGRVFESDRLGACVPD